MEHSRIWFLGEERSRERVYGHQFSLLAVLLIISFSLPGCGNEGRVSLQEDKRTSASLDNSSGEAKSTEILALQRTVLKKMVAPSEKLPSKYKCEVEKGEEILVQDVREWPNGHVSFLLKTSPKQGCSLKTVFAFVNHFEIPGLSTRPVPPKPKPKPKPRPRPDPDSTNGFNQNTNALLDVLAYAEGTDNNISDRRRTGYNIIFSYQTFQSFDDHPRRTVCSSGYCSTAAGRYQFLSSTWDETRKPAGLPDFRPVNQDRGAVHRLSVYRGVRNHNVRLTRSKFERVIYKLNREWASLPGSPYGQPTRPMQTLFNAYMQSL